MSKQYLFSLLIIFFIFHTAFAESFKCEKDGFFPDKKDCWIYHICVGTTHSVKACKEDLLFNPIKNECDWAMNVKCINKTSYEDILPITKSPHNLYPPDFKIPSPDSFFDYLCRSVDNDFIAHPTDCKRYAYCANGVSQAKVCQKSLMWSQAEKMCVWPAQSDCPVKHLNPSPAAATSINRDIPWMPRGTTYPSSYILTDAPSYSSSSYIHKSSSVCPPTKSWRIPDPYDCSIYHDCYDGNDLISYCPAQLRYNPEKQACDYEENVVCKNKCTVKNDGARFVDPQSCCHYYECISGKIIPQTCTHPNLFDVQTRKCLPYKRVKCDGRRQCFTKCHYLSSYVSGKSFCDFIPSCTGHSDGFYLDRTKPNCQSYIHCQDNRVANQSRCPQGQRFNRNMGRCTSADQVPCHASSSIHISMILYLLLIASNIIL